MSTHTLNNYLALLNFTYKEYMMLWYFSFTVISYWLILGIINYNNVEDYEYKIQLLVCIVNFTKKSRKCSRLNILNNFIITPLSPNTSNKSNVWTTLTELLLHLILKVIDSMLHDFLYHNLFRIRMKHSDFVVFRHHHLQPVTVHS